MTRRHTVGEASRPSSSRTPAPPASPADAGGGGAGQGPRTEPIPVPTQKAAYQQIQQSLVRSRSRSGDSMAMSDVGSTTSGGGSTLGPLPEEAALHLHGLQRQHRDHHRFGSPSSVSAAGSQPAIEGRHLKSRRISHPSGNPGGNPAVPDICHISPPNVQFLVGGSTPPAGHRRRTSSSSSCGGASPPVGGGFGGCGGGGWQISPTAATSPAAMCRNSSSPLRRAAPSSSTGQGFVLFGGNNPPTSSTLSPIQGSPNRLSSTTIVGGTHDYSGGGGGGGSSGLAGGHHRAADRMITNRAFTVPENLSSHQQAPVVPIGCTAGGGDSTAALRRRSTELQLAASGSRNVVLSYNQLGMYIDGPRRKSWSCSCPDGINSVKICISH